MSKAQPACSCKRFRTGVNCYLSAYAVLFSKHRPSGPMLSQICDVSLFPATLSVCPPSGHMINSRPLIGQPSFTTKLSTTPPPLRGGVLRIFWLKHYIFFHKCFTYDQIQHNIQKKLSRKGQEAINKEKLEMVTNGCHIFLRNKLCIFSLCS